MKKLYTLLCTTILVFAYTNISAQVLVVEDFEDPNALNITDFSGWNTGLPPFGPNTTTPCEGSQSARSAELSSTNDVGELFYVSQKTTGRDVKVSFDYKIVDKATGSPVSGNFGKLYLEYTTSGTTTPTTAIPWTKYDSISKAPTSTGCERYSYTLTATDLPSGSDFGWRLRIAGDPTYLSTNSYYVYVDNFMAVEQVDCIQPVNAKIVPNSITFEGAKISWEDVNTMTPGQWEVVYCSKGNVPPSPFCNPRTPPFSGPLVPIQVSSPEITFDDLQDGTEYDVFVRSVCGGGNGNSRWTGPIQFQTIAIGSICSAPIEINVDPDNPDVSADLPYETDDNTLVYADDILPLEGSPGISCAGSGNLLDGYEVVYHYTSETDDILTIDLTQLTGTNVGMYVYESCADIGNECFDGDVTADGSDLNIDGVRINAGEDIYIVIASLDNTGEPGDTDYHLKITGFDCANWGPPKHKTPMPFPFTAGQTLNKFSMKIPNSPYVLPTIGFAELQWYAGVDGSGNPINPITDPENIDILPGDVFYVTQILSSCESPALKVTFAEFFCNQELGGITGTTEDFACGSGRITLKATANTMETSEIQWYDSETGGKYLATGGTYTTPEIEQTTSYWVTEVFLGLTLMEHEAHKGPTTYESHQEDATTGSSSDDDWGVIIKPEQDFTLMDVKVYSTGGGNSMIVKLLEEDNGDPIYQESFDIIVGTATSPVRNTLKLNWELEAGKTYYMVHENEFGGNPGLLIDSDPDFPYPVGTSGFVISGGRFYETSTGYTYFYTEPEYYYFFDWTIVGTGVLCEKTPRTEVVATVHDIIPTQVSADDLQVCKGTSTQLHVTSTDEEYVYSWEWEDATGTTHTDSGPDITVTPNQSTTYTVTAVNPITTCEFINEIRVVVIGVEDGDLPVEPSTVEICQGEIVSLTAGGLKFDFNENATGWTQANQSTDPNGNPVPSAAWKRVASPYQLAGGVRSNDNSTFLISMADSIGPGGELLTALFSPQLNLVGVSSASLNFYHYYKDRDNNFQSTKAVVEVSVNNSTNWVEIARYGEGTDLEDEGEPTNFAFESLDLSEFVGSSNVRVRFVYYGDWGWLWAIDNVTLTRNYLNGSLTWAPQAGLFYDEGTNIPYDGAPTSTVYYNGDEAESTTYTATLTVAGCGGTTQDVQITVYNTEPPTGPTTQEFDPGASLKDLDVEGKDLRWYIIDENGNYDQVSANTPLLDGQTYYVTQTLNECESEFLSITVSMVCPKPQDLGVTVTYGNNEKVQALVEWSAPDENVVNIESYRVVVDSLNATVFETLVKEPFIIIDGLSQYTEYKVDIYSVCDIEDSAYSDSISHSFITLRNAGFEFTGLSYYPNPTKNVVYFENQIPIQRIAVYDLTGRQVFKKEISATSAPVNFSNLASGTYMVAITVDGVKRMIKIIKE